MRVLSGKEQDSLRISWRAIQKFRLSAWAEKKENKTKNQKELMNQWELA